MTTVEPRPLSFMAKTPFLRNQSSSFDDDEAEEEEENSNHEIQMKKVANAMPVMNKMSQSVYAENQAQYPPKGN